MNTAATIPAPPRRRRWPMIALAGLFVLAVPTACFLGRAWSESRVLDEVIAETDRLDPGWRFDDLQVARTAIPAEKNGALQVLRVKPLSGKPTRLTDAQSKLLDDVPPERELNGQQRAILVAFLAPYDKALPEARKVKDYSQGRYPIEYRDVRALTPLPQVDEANVVSHLLLQDARFQTQEGNHQLAVDDVRALLAVGRVIGDEPCLFTFSLRAMNTHHAVRALERVLAQAEPDPEALKAVQDVLGQMMGEPALFPALRGARAMAFDFVEAMRLRKVAPADLGIRPRTWFERAMRGQVLTASAGDVAETLRLMNEAVAAAQLPLHEQAEVFQRLNEASKATRLADPLMLVRLSHLSETNCRYHAELRCAVAALAAERHRRLRGDWPASLEALVGAGVLAAVPSDPFDGKPLRFRRTGDGVVVYSVGADRSDNGGKMDRAMPLVPGSDIAFRLWDVGARRQAALPPVALPEQQDP